MNITISDIDFAVESKDETSGTIIVNFFAKGYTMQCRVNLSLPISEDNKIPSGEALTAFIMQFAPVEYLDKEITRYKSLVMVDYSEIDQLISAGKAKVPSSI